MEEELSLFMKITDSNLSTVTTASQPAGATPGTGAARANSAGAGAARSDHIQLSNLTSALASLSAGGPQQEARVEHLSSAYQSGRYHVDAHQVSRQLIGDALHSG